MILVLINERHKCKYCSYDLNTKSQHSVSSTFNLHVLVCIKSGSCPLVREVLLFSTIPAAWGTEVSNIFCSPASKSPLDFGVQNVCCRVSACRTRLPTIQRSWGWRPDLLLASCILEAEQLLFTSPL